MHHSVYNLKDIVFKKKKNITFSVDNQWYDTQLLLNAAESSGVKLEAKKEHFLVTAKNEQQAFDFANYVLGYDFETKIKSYKKPTLSCIILCSGNHHFVKHRVIPSIISTLNIPYEIIVVNNSTKAFPKMKHVKTIKSDFAHISKAYNKGIKAAKGKYIAIFHDDCIVYDCNWFDICKKELTKDVKAVSPEITLDVPFNLMRLKATPLVMKGKHYYDEHYFFGFEELDFCYQLLKKGYEYKRVNFVTEHIRALGTILLFSGRDDLNFYFGLNLIPKQDIRNLTNYFLDVFLAMGFNLVTADNEIHFYEKFLNLFGGQKRILIEEYVSSLKHKIQTSDKKQIYNYYKNNRKKFIKQVKNLKIPIVK